MKIRDLVLLLAGGGLVVFGMVVGDLLENDAFADDHAKTELSELELKQKVKSRLPLCRYSNTFRSRLLITDAAFLKKI